MIFDAFFYPLNLCSCVLRGSDVDLASGFEIVDFHMQSSHATWECL